MITFKIKFSAEELRSEVTQASTEAEKTLAAQVLQDSNYYLPMRTGALKNLSHIEDGSDGTAVVWPGPYAAFLYNGKLMVDPETGSSYAPKYGHKVPTDKDIKIWQASLKDSSKRNAKRSWRITFMSYSLWNESIF